MADKKTISIEFKETDPNSTPPPAPPPPNPPQQTPAEVQHALDQQRILDGIFERFQQNNARIEAALQAGNSPPSNQGPHDDGSWAFQNMGGDNPDPFGIFDTSQVNPGELQASIDALNTEFQALSEASQTAAKAGLASSEAASGLAGGANAAAAALGGGGGGAGGGGVVVGGAAAGLAGAALGAAAALLSVVAGGIAFNAAVDSMVESVGALSAEVAAASAESRVQEIRDRIRLAEEAGPEVAGLERQRSEIASELRGIYREGIEAIAPELRALGTVLSTLLSILRSILELISDVRQKMESAAEYVTGLAAELPLVGTVFRKLNVWLTANNVDVKQNSLQRQIDDIFSPANIGGIPLDFNRQPNRDQGDPR